MQRKQSRKEYKRSCQIFDEKSYCLGGYTQKVFLEGKKASNPMVLFLHGGPGSPFPFCAGGRGLFPEITDEYTMIYWDQLGCGINDFLIDDHFTIAHYVSMTVDLIRAISRDFPGQPIHLFGVSWGSLLAVKAARQIPELIGRVMVYGQVVKDLFFNREVYDCLQKAAVSDKERERIAALEKKVDHTKEDMGFFAGLIRKYTEGYQAKEDGKMPIGRILWGILTSPDYSFANCKALVVNGTRNNRSLYHELLEIGLTEDLAKICVPYLILQGETDIVSSSKQVQEVVRHTANPCLSFYPVAGSGHIPGEKGMTAVLEKGFRFLRAGI